jgi:hypothetical protein
MMREFLVFFRAGPNSLHPRLIAAEPERNWDCCVSWYCAPRDEPAAEYSVTGGENKFEAFHDFYQRIGSQAGYRYYLVLDDDIDFAPGDISRFLALCERHGTYLCQPALRWGTNSNHDVTLWNPACELRTTTFIEVMAPCFSAEAVTELQDTFLLNRSTWGIDYAWASRINGRRPIAIVDAVRVAHTKPVDLGDGPFYRKMRELGADPEEEYGRIKASFPRFGALRTAPAGHIFRLPLPAPVGNLLVALCEKLKKRIHRRLAAQN